MSKTDRILYIQKELEERGFFSATQVAHHFKTSLRSVKRDIEYLRYSLAVPIKYDRGRENSYRISKEDQKALKIKLYGEGLLLYSLIESFCKTHCLFPIDLERLKRDLGLPVGETEDQLCGKISYEMSEQKRLNGRLFHLLLESMAERKSLIITYENLKHMKSQRLIEPYHITNNDGQWYLTAWCHRSKDLRIFHLSRIQNWKDGDGSFKSNLSQEEINKFLHQGYGVMAGKESLWNVELLFTGEAAVLIRGKHWHFKEKIDETNDGTKVSFPVESFEQILRTILFYHSEVEVLAPRELRQLWIEKIQEMGRKVKSMSKNVPVEE